jgi:uncharacterized protein
MSLASEFLAFDRAPAPIDIFGRELFAFDRSSSRTYDADDRLHVDVCNISKATVNPYYGREIPDSERLGLDPNQIYRLYRDPLELERAAPTFARIQLLDTHIAVNASDPKKEFVAGCIGSDVRFENPYLKASLAVWVKESIQKILARKSAQLSCSYRYDAEMTPGVTPGGLAYDGIMRNIVGNHVALVREGRAGPDVYVTDSLPIGLRTSMRFPKILSVVASAITGLTESQKLAIDAALEEESKKGEDAAAEEAMDARECSLDEREEAMDSEMKDPAEEVAKGDRKKARDSRKSARDKRAADRKAKDGNWGLGGKDKKGKDSDPTLEDKERKLKGGNDSQVDLSKYVLKADADKMASDASDAAVARVTAIETARREVAPLVGQIVVAMDSAEAVYRFALDQVKATHKDVHPSALSALVSAEIRARRAPAPRGANDAAHGVSINDIFKTA